MRGKLRLWLRIYGIQILDLFLLNLIQSFIDTLVFLLLLTSQVILYINVCIPTVASCSLANGSWLVINLRLCIGYLLKPWVYLCLLLTNLFLPPDFSLVLIMQKLAKISITAILRCILHSLLTFLSIWDKCAIFIRLLTYFLL